MGKRDRQVYSLLFAAAIAGAFGPLAVLAYIAWGIFSGVEDSFVNMEGKALHGGISAGADWPSLRKRKKRIAASAALPGEAPRNSSLLKIVVVNYYKSGGPQLAKRPGKVYIPVELDVAALNQAGIVLIHGAPTFWKIINAQPGQRAKLAFEGRAPIMAAPLPQGLIAGIKIRSFGAHGAISSKDLKEKRSRFCSASIKWADYFEIDPRRIYVWQVDMPDSGGRLTLTDYTVSSKKGDASLFGPLTGVCSNEAILTKLGYGN